MGEWHLTIDIVLLYIGWDQSIEFHCAYRKLVR